MFIELPDVLGILVTTLKLQDALELLIWLQICTDLIVVYKNQLNVICVW